MRPSIGEEYTLEYLKSFISLNTVIGCPVGCVYCFLSPMGWVPSQPQKAIEADKLIENLRLSRYFLPHKTPLSINNRTDTFLNKDTRQGTFSVLERLDKAEYKNPVLITSKLRITPEDIDRLNQFKNVNIFILITYSEMPYEMEPTRPCNQLTSFENLQKGNVNIIHLWRPLIQGYNTDSQRLEAVLRNVVGKAHCSIVGGLRMNEFILGEFAKKDLSYPYDKLSPVNKYLPPDHTAVIKELRDEITPDYKLFRHTSCVISWKLGIADYNAHWTVPSNCMFGCPNVDRCTAKQPPKDSEIIPLLNYLEINAPFSVQSDQVWIDGKITQEERSFLRHSLAFKVLAKETVMSPSEHILAETEA